MNTSDTFDLAKAFYNMENARKRFELLLKAQISSKSKIRLGGYEKRLQWIINDMLTSLPRESAEIFRAQVCTWETLAFESIFDELVLMPEEKRAVFEDVTKAFRKGELVITN